jgi:signal transduction histidine kinase
MKLFYILLLALIFQFGLAQQNITDSLIRRLPDINNNAEKADVLNDICYKLVYMNPDSALLFGKQALLIGRKANDDKIIGNSYNRIGIVYDVKNIWDSALMYYDSALLHSKRVYDSITIASAYNNIGLVYWNKSLLDKAIQNFFNSLKLFEKLGKKKGVANTFNNIGLILMEQDRNTEALGYQMKGLKLREELNDESGVNDSRLNIAINLWELENFDSSAFYFKGVIPFYQQTSNHYALGTTYNGLAMVLMSIHEYDSSLVYYDKAIQEHLAVENNSKAASSLLNKATLYNTLGQMDNELNALLKARSLLSDGSSLKVLWKTLFQLAEVYRRKGQYKLAAELYKEAYYTKDSVHTLERDEKIEQIKVRYETEKREKELILERAENERLQKEKAESEIKIYNRNNWIIGLGSISLIMILFILFISQRNKRKAQAERDAAIIKEREFGLRAVFTAQEDERKRIAKDLHDGIGQQLSAIKLNFHNVCESVKSEKPEISADLLRVEKMIANTGSEVRSISHQMMPRALTELGLVDALDDLIVNSFGNTNVKYSYDHFGLTDRLPSNIEIALYRIAQELFNNIIKHAGASSVDVQLMKREKYCILIVQDNGKGIPQTGLSDGIGMLNINNRLSTINGELNMDSGEGEGTIATIRIALT